MFEISHASPPLLLVRTPTTTAGRLPYSLFYATDFEAAIPEFLDLLEVDQYEKMNVQWHLLLCYVAVGEESETRFLLYTILKNPKHKYNQKAVELKKALKI